MTGLFRRPVGRPKVRHALREPESISHATCPVETRDRYGDSVVSKFFEVTTHRIDDVAGHQRTWKCEACQTTIRINFPPA